MTQLLYSGILVHLCAGHLRKGVGGWVGEKRRVLTNYVLRDALIKKIIVFEG